MLTWTQNRIIDFCLPKLSVPPQFFLILFIVSHLPNIKINDTFLVLPSPKPLSHSSSCSSVFIFKCLPNSPTYSISTTAIHIPIVCPLDYYNTHLMAYLILMPTFTIHFPHNRLLQMFPNKIYIIVLIKLFQSFFKAVRITPQHLVLDYKTYMIDPTYTSHVITYSPTFSLFSL